MLIKHISMDGWNTLLEPNPNFSMVRSALISERSGSTLDVARNIYTDVKRQIDWNCESSGFVDPIEVSYRKLCDHTGIKDAVKLREDITKLFRMFPPRIDSTVRKALRKIHNRYGITLSVTSNTNFISGTVVAEAINKYDIPLDFMLYSDLLGVCKPNKAMFDQVVQHSRRDPIEILHIGDSLTCDKLGAEAAGMNAILVSDHNSFIEVVHNLLLHMEVYSHV